MRNTRPTLLHSLATISLLLAGTGPLSAQKNQVEEEKKPWWDAPQPRFSKSELGGVFSGTVDMRGDAKVSHRTIYKQHDLMASGRVGRQER